MLRNLLKKFSFVGLVTTTFLFANSNTNIIKDTVKISEVENMVKIYKKNLPLKLNNLLTATDLKFDKKNKELKFIFKINTEVTKSDDLIKSLEIKRLRIICKKPTFKRFINAGYTIDYIYITNKNRLIELKISKDSCENALKNTNRNIKKLNKKEVFKKAEEEVENFAKIYKKKFEENIKKNTKGTYIVNVYYDKKNNAVVYEYNVFSNKLYKEIDETNKNVFSKLLEKNLKKKICTVKPLKEFIEVNGKIIYKYKIFKENANPISNDYKTLEIEIKGKC